MDSLDMALDGVEGAASATPEGEGSRGSPLPSTLDFLSVEKIAELCFVDPVLFCRYFLQHLFSRPMPWVHRGLLAILLRKTDFLAKYGEIDKIIRNFTYKEDPGDPLSPEHSIFLLQDGKLKLSLGKYTLIILPRGFSKTTLAGIATPLFDTLYHIRPFTAYLSESAPHSKMQLDNVKREIEVNPRIIRVFGKLKPEQNDSARWREDLFETTSGVAFVGRGRGGQIRGLLHRGNRPSKIIFDDVEDKESVATPEQRLKTRTWAYGDMIPALPELDPEATITGLGTILHPESLLSRLSLDPEWTVVKFGALDKDGSLLWPDNMDQRKLDRRKQSFAMQGLIHVFYMEYFNECRTPEDQKFRPENIIVKDPEEINHTAIYVDPAISGKVDADRTSICVGGMNAKGKIWLIEHWTKRGATPRETIDEYFRLAKLYRCSKHGVESNAYQAALVHLMREEMFRKKHYFEVIPVTHHSKKDERILGILGPRYASQYIFHAKHFPEMNTELLDYPNGRKDGPDSWAGCIALLDPYAASAAGDLDLGEDEYEPLDKVLGGNWRSS